jgi:ABC-2 type transport system ATP-binding protein
VTATGGFDAAATAGVMAASEPAAGHGRLTAVRIEQLTKRYGRTVALDTVDLTLGRGITGLLGPNGAGKTTLLSILATVASPDAGRLSVLGFDPADAAERVEIRRRLGFLPQDLGYHRHFTVAAFLDYVAILKEITDSRRRHAEIARVLAAVGLQAQARHRIRTLSGGMRRRLGLAQALLGQPELLVLDEPAAGLDPEQRLRFRELLSGLADDPVVLLATHQVEDVTAICSRVVVLLGGTVRFAGTPAALATKGEGRVWVADERHDAAELSWRSGDGSWRHIGREVPPGARVARPTAEDGYLVLSGAAGRVKRGDDGETTGSRWSRRRGGRP